MEPRQLAETLIVDYAAAVSTQRPNLIAGAKYRIDQLLDTWYPQQPAQPTEQKPEEQVEAEQV